MKCDRAHVSNTNPRKPHIGGKIDVEFTVVSPFTRSLSVCTLGERSRKQERTSFAFFDFRKL
jgi:hypothetical protein